MTRGFKSDAAARAALGTAYDAVPKSAFALIAYHLANLCADEPDTQAGILDRIGEEAAALALNGIMPVPHATIVMKAIAKAKGGAA